MSVGDPPFSSQELRSPVVGDEDVDEFPCQGRPDRFEFFCPPADTDHMIDLFDLIQGETDDPAI